MHRVINDRPATTFLFGILFLAPLAVSCGKSTHEPAPSTSSEAARAVAPVSADDPWLRHILALRASKDREFATSPTSPMAGIQFLKSQPGNLVHITNSAKDIRFGLAQGKLLGEPMGRAVPLSFAHADGTWTLTYKYDVTARKPGPTAGETVDLAVGAKIDRSVTFTIDRFTASVYPEADTLTFKLFDPERAEFKNFKHLEYFPPDKRYAVPATLRKTDSRDEVVMLTSQNLEKTFYLHAKIAFQLDGQAVELSAYKYARSGLSGLSGSQSDYLFIPFKDTTSGKETYGAGRYLDVKEPQTERFTLDFNEAYNPLCNYSSAYNCPMPPRENHLPVAIRAGEMTYPH